MKRTFMYGLLGLAALVSACQQDNDSVTPDNGVVVNSDFKQNTDSWTGDFTDYSTQQDSIMAFSLTHKGLPAPLDTTKKALRISGSNRSDDMFMFVKRKVTGLTANTTYQLRFDIELASMYADNSIGSGGSPGGSVYLKAGASATEPAKVKENDFYHLNLDKGNQAEGGKDLIVLGNVGAGTDVTQYKLIQRDNATKTFSAKTNDKGELWVIVGTDSGFEGITTLYYNKIKVTATKITN
nr:hypothetical protein [uncultured Arsenicibacter sp.]